MSHRNFAHRYFGAVPSTFSNVVTNPTDNNASTLDTVSRMQQLAIAQSRSRIIQLAVMEAIQGSENGSLVDRLNAIFQYIKSNIKFVEDESVLSDIFGVDVDKELLITPERLLTMPIPAGDCDDFSTLAAAMVIALNEGVGVNFVTIAAERQDPDRFSHVYVAVYLPGTNKRIAFDSSHGSYFGWETNEIYRIEEWCVMSVKRLGLHGLSGLGQFSPTGEPMGGYIPEVSPGAVNLTSVLVNGINTGIQATSRIFESRYGGVQPGGYQRTPEGGVIYRLPTGGANVGFTTMPDIGIGGGTIQWLLIGVGAFGIMMLLTRSKGGK